MAFFDKLNLDKINLDTITGLAKSVGDKANNMLEIGKLNAQIGSANSSVRELKERLGDHYWQLFNEGKTLDDDAVVLCSTIKDYTEEIAALKAQVEELKASSKNANVCDACGEENAEDALFCKKCGARLTVDAPEETSQETVVECVTDEPAVKTCPNCHAENPSENNFCDKCGAKL